MATDAQESPPDRAVADQFEAYVSMQDTDASGALYAFAPANWAQIGVENLFRGAGRPIEKIVTDEIHFPVVRVEVNHSRRLPLGSLVTVRTWIAQVGNTSFRMETEIWSQGEICASVSRTSVAVHREHGPVPVPAWLEALTKAEAGAVAFERSS